MIKKDEVYESKINFEGRQNEIIIDYYKYVFGQLWRNY